MNHQEYLRAEFVEFIPKQLEPGIIYISRRFSTASHLCCSGCGLKVVTPINPAKWSLTESEGKVSLYPSIGNWSFPCKSHYWIIEGQIHWAGKLPPEKIQAIQNWDMQDARTNAQIQNRSKLYPRWISNMWAKVVKLIRRLFLL